MAQSRIPGIAVADGPIEVAERRGAKAQFRTWSAVFPMERIGSRVVHDPTTLCESASAKSGAWAAILPARHRACALNWP